MIVKTPTLISNLQVTIWQKNQESVWNLSGISWKSENSGCFLQSIIFGRRMMRNWWQNYNLLWNIKKCPDLQPYCIWLVTWQKHKKKGKLAPKWGRFFLCYSLGFRVPEIQVIYISLLAGTDKLRFRKSSQTVSHLFVVKIQWAEVVAQAYSSVHHSFIRNYYSIDEYKAS